MSSFNIEIKGLNSVVKKLEDIPKQVEQTLQDELNNFGQETVNMAKSLCPVDEGFLRNSITYDSQRLSVTIVVAANYAAYVEFGTGQFAAEYVNSLPGEWVEFAAQFRGKGGGTFQELVLRITEWVHRKGITGTYSVKTRKRTGNATDNAAIDKQVAYLIARKIMITGIRPQPFLVPAVEANRIKLKQNLDTIFK